MNDHSDFGATAAPRTHDARDQETPFLTEALEAKRTEKPAHYKVICISMYTKDLDHLDNMVESLKAKGMTKANRSALIRYALGEVNLDHVPQGL